MDGLKSCPRCVVLRLILTAHLMVHIISQERMEVQEGYKIIFFASKPQEKVSGKVSCLLRVGGRVWAP